nr:SdrD B-like domain-containing protein [Pararoseomonas indoligenes]
MVVPRGAPYSFTGLLPGPYQLDTATPDGVETAESAGRSACFTLASGGTVTSGAATIHAPGTIIGSTDLHDCDEAFGMAGATVRLLSAAGARVAVTIAGAGGAYAFNGIAPGWYRVEISASTGSAQEGGTPLRTALFRVPETALPAGPVAAARKGITDARGEESSSQARGRTGGPSGQGRTRREARLPGDGRQPPMTRRSAGAIRSVAAAPTISP